MRFGPALSHALANTHEPIKITRNAVGEVMGGGM